MNIDEGAPGALLRRACGSCIGLAFGQAMLQRNMGFVFADPKWVSRYRLSLHFTCKCSSAALQQTCGSGHEPQKNLWSKINIPQHSA
ncbi:MAG: hypothetical protein ACHQAQ_17620 [Hyphomicrobiales bacterium]